MEMIMVSDRKLKVMLSAEDLARFELDADELDYANTETKRMFWDILNRAKQTVGFNTDGHRVLVQLFPSKKGGCEIFVTKMGIHPDGTSDSPIRAHTHDRYAGVEPRSGAYAFDGVDALLSVCRRLSDFGYGGESEAYIGDNRRYYLLLDGMTPSDYLPLDEYSFIGEYGCSESAEATRHYLSEHGTEICASDAVRILGAI